MSCRNPIADAAQGLDLLAAKLLSHAADVNFDCVTFHLCAEGIDRFFELAFRDDRPGMAQQDFEEPPLAGGKIDRLTSDLRSARRQIDFKIADVHKRIGISGISAGHRTDTRIEFIEIERLDDVIVRPGVEPRDAV